MPEKFIYVDNAATTKVSEKCLDSMLPFLTENFGNPSSIYSIANSANLALERARKKAANAIGAKPEEIFFTSGGTESNNWAIKSSCSIGKKEGKNSIITSNIEHHSVLNCFKNLEKDGYDVTFSPVDEDGILDVEKFKRSIKKTTSFVSIMCVNNEIGTIQPIEEISQICKENNIIFHTDAIQAVGHINLSLEKSNINLLSISGHKINAPKGVGLLYVKKGTKIQNFLHGGGQEKNLRPGTQNVAFAVGLATALEEATRNIEGKEKQVKILRDYLLDQIKNRIEKFKVNGSLEKRVSGNLNLSFEGIEGESLLLLLDSQKICASSGSACTSNSLEPSHVLLAIGLDPALAHGSLRISLNANNTKEEIDKIVEVLEYSVNRLRKISPIWK